MSQLDLMHETLGSGFLLVMTGIGMTLFVNGDFSMPRVVLRVSRTRARAMRAKAQWGSHIQRTYRKI